MDACRVLIFENRNDLTKTLWPDISYEQEHIWNMHCHMLFQDEGDCINGGVYGNIDAEYTARLIEIWTPHKEDPHICVLRKMCELLLQKMKDNDAESAFVGMIHSLGHKG